MNGLRGRRLRRALRESDSPFLAEDLEVGAERVRRDDRHSELLHTTRTVVRCEYGALPNDNARFVFIGIDVEVF